MPSILNLLKLRRFANAGDAAAEVAISSDTEPRLRIDAGGKLTWGAGGTTAGDTTLYRSAADVLRTDDAFVASGGLTIKTIEVDPAGATSNQVLAFNGTKFAPANASGGGSTLDALSDVNTPSPVSGDVLRHNGTEWVNGKATLGTNTSGTYVTTISGSDGVTATASDNVSTGARTYLVSLSQNLSVSSLTVTGATNVQQVREKVVDSSISSNVMTCDYSNGTVFYQATAPSANFTVNLTNAPGDNGNAITLTIFVVQGTTGYIPSAVQVAGSAQTIKWGGGSAPTPTSSSGKIDVFSFIFVRRGSAWTVFGNANLNY